MKKLLIFCSFIFSSLSPGAQPKPAVKQTVNQKPPPDVCSVVGKILVNRENDFSNIYTGKVADAIPDEDKKAVPGVEGLGPEPGYNAKLKFPGAKANFVSSVEKEGKLYYRHVAYYGSSDHHDTKTETTKENNNPPAKNKNKNVIGTYTDQGNDFCKRLSEIMTHAHTNFEKIKTEENQEGEEPPLEGEISLAVSLIHKASLKFPGAKLSSIGDAIRGPDKYEAYFGFSETETLATKRIDSMKTQLVGCLNGYKVQKESRSDYSGEYPVIYVFDEKRTDKKPAQHLQLYMAKKNIYIDGDNKDVFKIYLYINGLRPL